jgi:hypothetical protein
MLHIYVSFVFLMSFSLLNTYIQPKYSKTWGSSWFYWLGVRDPENNTFQTEMHVKNPKVDARRII